MYTLINYILIMPPYYILIILYINNFNFVNYQLVIFLYIISNINYFYLFLFNNINIILLNTAEYLPILHIGIIFFIWIVLKILFIWLKNFNGFTRLLVITGVIGLIWASFNFNVTNWWSLNDMTEMILLLSIVYVYTNRHLNYNIKCYTLLYIIILLIYVNISLLYLSNISIDNIIHKPNIWYTTSTILFVIFLTKINMFSYKIYILRPQNITTITRPIMYILLTFLLLSIIFVIFFPALKIAVIKTYSINLLPGSIIVTFILTIIPQYNYKKNDISHYYIILYGWFVSLLTCVRPSWKSPIMIHIYVIFIVILLFYYNNVVYCNNIPIILYPKIITTGLVMLL